MREKKGKVKLFVLTAQLILKCYHYWIAWMRLKIIESEGIQRIYKVKLLCYVQLPYNWYVSLCAHLIPMLFYPLCGYGRVSPSQALCIW